MKWTKEKGEAPHVTIMLCASEVSEGAAWRATAEPAIPVTPPVTSDRLLPIMIGKVSRSVPIIMHHVVYYLCSIFGSSV